MFGLTKIVPNKPSLTGITVIYIIKSFNLQTIYIFIAPIRLDLWNSAFSLVQLFDHKFVSQNMDMWFVDHFGSCLHCIIINKPGIATFLVCLKLCVTQYLILSWLSYRCLDHFAFSNILAYWYLEKSMSSCSGKS